MEQSFTYHKELFKVDEEGKATVVGGCPPDAFAEDGQVWSILYMTGNIIRKQITNGG